MKTNKNFRFPKYRGMNIQWSEDSLFDKWSWGNSTDIIQESETRPLSYIRYKNKHKMG